MNCVLYSLEHTVFFPDIHRVGREQSGHWKKGNFNENNNNNNKARSSKLSLAGCIQKAEHLPTSATCAGFKLRPGSVLLTPCGPLDLLLQRTISLGGLCLNHLCAPSTQQSACHLAWLNTCLLL